MVGCDQASAARRDPRKAEAPPPGRPPLFSALLLSGRGWQAVASRTGRLVGQCIGFAQLSAQPAGRKQDRGHLNSDHVSLLNTSAFKSIFVQSPVSPEATAHQQSGFPSGPSSERFLPDPGKNGLCVPRRGAGHRGLSHRLSFPFPFSKRRLAVQGRREAGGAGARSQAGWWWGCVCVRGCEDCSPGFSA